MVEEVSEAAAREGTLRNNRNIIISSSLPLRPHRLRRRPLRGNNTLKPHHHPLRPPPLVSSTLSRRLSRSSRRWAWWAAAAYSTWVFRIRRRRRPWRRRLAPGPWAVALAGEMRTTVPAPVIPVIPPAVIPFPSASASAVLLNASKWPRVAFRRPRRRFLRRPSKCREETKAWED